jgi:transcription termination factor Rho
LQSKIAQIIAEEMKVREESELRLRRQIQEKAVQV